MKWRAVASSSDCVRLWGDEYVVYNPQSGNTHLLGLAAGQILQRLQDAPLELRDLVSLLESDWRQVGGPELMQEVASLLEDMHALALVERV